MPTHIAGPALIAAPGEPPKRIEEFVVAGELGNGQRQHRANDGSSRLGGTGSDTRLRRVHGRASRALRVEHDGGFVDVRAGEAIVTHAGERIRYSTPGEGAEYIAVCLPAFSPEAVHRD